MDRDRITRAGLVVYGAEQLLQGLWMAVAPGSFFSAIGPFGDRNDHYVRDAATWSLALGVLCLIGARLNAQARGALLGFAGLQAALHTVNHVIDAGDADPGWVGIFDAATLAALAAGLLYLARETTKETPA